MQIVKEEIKELLSMKKYPPKLYYDGNLDLLKRKKVSIVGSRKPTKYSRMIIQNIASLLSKSGICIVSGGAMGIDAIAHMSAGSSNTISVLPCGVDIRYPAVNKNLLMDIQKRGLLISQFDLGFRATPWSFVVRNELVVALGDILIVAEADIGSGSMRSIEFALKMGKEIFVLPQRLGESGATNELLKNKKAHGIYDIDEFVSQFVPKNISINLELDDFTKYCKTNPNYEEAIKKYPSRLFEAELSGEIIIKNAKIFLNN